jgi:predicted ATPase/DNA-binding SARP family transcriptional activator
MRHSPELRVEVLGPLRLLVDDKPVDVPGPKRRAVLALLARAEGRAVSVDDLLDALWGSDPPDAAKASLHSHISRLRGHLGPAAARLESMDGAYRLVLDEGSIDSSKARSLLTRARGIATSEPAHACALLREARALWRGSVLADIIDVAPIAAWSLSLGELRTQVDDLLVACSLDAGELNDAVQFATQNLADDPLRERAVHQLMRALAATGRGADALRAAHTYRRRLVEETGLDPSPELGELEREIASGGGDTSPITSRGAIPKPATPLFGRDGELAAIRRLVAGERLITVVGPGGVGKTRVAIEVARRADDATMLLLAPVTDPAAIPYALASALDLHVRGGNVLSACIALLGAGPRLLFVDNCEHLLDAARETVSALIDGCPELTILATSREPLGLAAERQCRLAPLALPDRDDPHDTGRAPAVAVFVERARRVQPDFVPSAGDLRVIGEIVRRLDGMPLAIELAAARMSSFGLDDLHARVDRSLDLLADGRTSADARHRTLRTTIGWSYDLLPAHEQRLFRHLSVFPDGVDLDTAERVAAEVQVAGDAAGALAHLVDASMINAELDHPTRYRMLETLRSFGLSTLDEVGETDEALDRLIRWAVDLASWVFASDQIADESVADAVLRRELANVRAAWLFARRLARLDDAVALVDGLQDFVGWRDLPELWGWAEELARDPAISGHDREAVVLGIAAANAWTRGDPSEARRLVARGFDVATDDEGRAWCLGALALIDLSRGNFSDAIGHALESAALWPQPNQNLGIAAVAAVYAGDLDHARALSDRLAATAQSPTLIAFSEYVAGEIENAAGDHERAEQHYSRSIELARSSGATFVAGIASVGLVTVRATDGRVDDALRGYAELIDYWEVTGSWIQQWTTLRNLAHLLHALGDHEPAVFLEVAADHAPEAPPTDDGTRSREGSDLGVDTLTRIRRDASSCSRSGVLNVARRAIDHHLTATSSRDR